MSLDPHQQQVALAVAVQVVAELAVAHQLHDQLPSVFRDWRREEWVFARLHQGANVPECPKLNANCLSRETVSPTSDTEIVETVVMIHWRDQRVCPGDVVRTCQDRFNRLHCESRFHHLPGHAHQRILSPTGCAEWLCKMNVTAKCWHSRNRRLRFHPEYKTRVVMMLQRLDKVKRTERVLAFSLNRTDRDVPDLSWWSDRTRSKKRFADLFRLHFPLPQPVASRCSHTLPEDQVFRSEQLGSSKSVHEESKVLSCCKDQRERLCHDGEISSLPLSQGRRVPLHFGHC